MASDEIDARLRRLPRSVLPAELRHRALESAAFGTAPDWRDRVWFSRGWRLAAAATLAIALFGDHWAVRPPADDRTGAVVTAGSPDPQVAAIADAAGVPADQARRLLSRVEVVQITAPAAASAAGVEADDIH
jgi:hypothetical protein